MMRRRFLIAPDKFKGSLSAGEAAAAIADGIRRNDPDAELDLWCAPALLEALGRLGDELRFVMICSNVRLHSLDQRPTQAEDTDLDGLAVQVTTCAHPKCGRCWHHREDVGADAAHPELCGRCVENVAGDGETRRYA